MFILSHDDFLRAVGVVGSQANVDEVFHEIDQEESAAEQDFRQRLDARFQNLQTLGNL